MATPTPISPPSATAAAPGPVSPISRAAQQGSFAHKTSPAVSTQTPFIDTSTPAINAVAVELDGSPASSVGGEGGKPGEGVEGVTGEKRAELIAEKSKDPGVIVDVPKEPTASEVEVARRSREGMPAWDRWAEEVKTKGG